MVGAAEQFRVYSDDAATSTARRRRRRLPRAPDRGRQAAVRGRVDRVRTGLTLAMGLPLCGTCIGCGHSRARMVSMCVKPNVPVEIPSAPRSTTVPRRVESSTGAAHRSYESRDPTLMPPTTRPSRNGRGPDPP